MPRLNRTVPIVLAGLFLAGGGLGLAMALGAFDPRHSQTRLLPAWLVADWLGIGPTARGSILVAAGVLLVLTGAGLTVSALRYGRPGSDELGDLLLAAPPRCRGRTLVRSGILADALERDVAREPSVVRARLGLRRAEGHLEVRGSLQVFGQDELEALQGRVHDALDRLSATAGMPSRLREVELDLITPAGRLR